MLLYFGYTPTLVVSSADMAREILTTHDIVFSNRPRTLAANILLYGCKDVGFSPYGEYWRQARKICVVELLSLKRVNSFQHVRDEEVAEVIESIQRTCLCGSLINLSELFSVLSANTVSRCVIGRKVNEIGGNIKLGELANKLTKEINEFGFSDRLPYFYLGYLMDILTGLVARLKKTSKEFDIFLDQVIDEHMTLENSNDEEPLDNKKKNFVHILLQLQQNNSLDFELTREKIKAILLDMFVAGIDTTSTTLEWTMAELIRNQNILKKAQDEVRRVVGNKSKVEGNDINMMNYLKCTIKESLRLHPPAPLLLPRETSKAINLGGYDIPPKTSVIINAMKIQKDPNIWERPEEFMPERFEENPVE
ncbi:cytochrome P450 71A1-like [Carica papaya]|uniref:cytochrome P450 71A1-like n=1 Tax=Carica papaya TaxID=3649 RepID=UPI000B8CC462|nr:cytochrome P450 71A1-like [Carica papaya]